MKKERKSHITPQRKGKGGREAKRARMGRAACAAFNLPQEKCGWFRHAQTARKRGKEGEQKGGGRAEAYFRTPSRKKGRAGREGGKKGRRL